MYLGKMIKIPWYEGGRQSRGFGHSPVIIKWTWGPPLLATFRHRGAHLWIYVGKNNLKLLLKSKSSYLSQLFSETLNKNLKGAWRTLFLDDLNKNYETYGINVDISFIYFEIYWYISSVSKAGKVCNCPLKFSLAGSNLTDILERPRSKFSPVSTLWNVNQLE